MSTRAREKSKKLIICKERLNRLFEELDQLCVGPAEVLEIEEQISMTERLFRETDALQVELELGLEEEERVMAEDDWSKYRKGFRERKARPLALMRSNGSDQPGRLADQGHASRSGPEVVTAATSVHELAARLPRCDLPKFSGDFTEFRAFWDKFDYRVHQRKDLSNAAKLTYLRGCLTGKAADVISRNADYEVALNRLREEFDRPAKAIRHQIEKLVQAPPKDVGLRSQYDNTLPFRSDPKPAGRLWKTLGVLWDPKSDRLSFRQPEVDAEAQDTKRTLLSLAATIFDPLGYLTPFTVRAKMLLQLLWQEGTSWDDPLPAPVAAVWRNWKGKLEKLAQVSIDRACIQCSFMELVHMDLHGFTDASGSAYGAVVYLRLVHGNGKVEVRFLAAKSRVAPIKKLSLPRLELMAALLCARLLTYVKREADLPIRSCFCWSESSVALCWI
ncbi:hypothetical protein T11_10900 [Trichinella zimbabwensis]|uniref:Uncharacterized protein n=1 Tax=Trichinella zimbabwensis TaxID=268475 RepID=A0A0V1GXK4_9BILA|nr:hypothetical protein T11_10900 [Trichinella zimbabwensis]